MTNATAQAVIGGGISTSFNPHQSFRADATQFDDLIIILNDVSTHIDPFGLMLRDKLQTELQTAEVSTLTDPFRPMLPQRLK